VKQKTEQEELIIRYLFRELPELRETEIEEQFLNDNEFFEQMLTVEDALIDDYAQGRLSLDDHRKVEQLLLPHDRLAREVGFVKDLLSDLAKARSEAEAKLVSAKPPFKWRSLLIWISFRDSKKQFSFVFLCVVIVSLTLIIWNVVLQNKLSRINSKQVALENERQELQRQFDTEIEKSEQLKQEVEAERSRSERLQGELALAQRSDSLLQPNDTVTAFLYPNSFDRGGGNLKPIHLSRGIKLLKIRIEVSEEDHFRSYNATLKTFDGRDVWSKYNIKPMRTRPGLISLTLPARLLANEDYTLRLQGQTGNNEILDIGDYSFRVNK
jgi:hypothetical protein